MKVSIITVSDSCVAGTRKDESGPTLVNLVTSSKKVSATIVGNQPDLVDDDIDRIEQLLRKNIQSSDVIITTGGTGFAPRDVTPEATLRVIDRRCSGLEMSFHMRSLQATPMAALSRAIAGISNKTLIVNMPGSVKAVKECWEVLEQVLQHAVDLITDTDNGDQHSKMKDNK